MGRTRWVWVCVCWLWANAAVAQPESPAPAARRQAVLPLIVHTATANPERTHARLQARLAFANRLYSTFGVRFEVSEQRELPGEHRVVETIRERRSFKGLVEDGAIHVFVVDRIEDPRPSEATRRAARWQGRELTSGRLAGAHIEAPTHFPATFILLASDAREATLAHELGHLFGLPHHRSPDNVMSYGPHPEYFDAAQSEHLSRRIWHIVRRLARGTRRARTADAS